MTVINKSLVAVIIIFRTKWRKGTEIRKWNQWWCPQLEITREKGLSLLASASQKMGVFKFCISYNVYIFYIYLSLNRLYTGNFQICELRFLCFFNNIFQYLKNILLFIIYYNCPNFPPLPPSTQPPTSIVNPILLSMSMSPSYVFFD